MLNTQSFSLIRILIGESKHPDPLNVSGKTLVVSPNPLGCADILSFFPLMIFSIVFSAGYSFLLSLLSFLANV